MARSWKIEGLRRLWENEHPDLAAESAARSFERAAIPIPDCLLHDDTVKPWRARQLDDAAVLYRDLVHGGG